MKPTSEEIVELADFLEDALPHMRFRDEEDASLVPSAIDMLREIAASPGYDDINSAFNRTLTKRKGAETNEPG